jgi:hypothetical protein
MDLLDPPALRATLAIKDLLVLRDRQDLVYKDLRDRQDLVYKDLRDLRDPQEYKDHPELLALQAVVQETMSPSLPFLVGMREISGMIYRSTDPVFIS